MNLLLLLAAVGATLVIVHGAVTMPVRRLWPKLLCCPQCTGFWVGCAFGVVNDIWGQPEAMYVALEVACYGFATSFLATATALLMYAASGSAGPSPPDPCAPKETEGEPP